MDTRVTIQVPIVQVMAALTKVEEGVLSVLAVVARAARLGPVLEDRNRNCS